MRRRLLVWELAILVAFAITVAMRDVPAYNHPSPTLAATLVGDARELSLTTMDAGHVFTNHAWAEAIGRFLASYFYGGMPLWERVDHVVDDSILD